MKPYFVQDGITLYCGDCREILPQLPAECMDLIVTDPPYGMRWQSASRRLAFDLIEGDDSCEAAVIGVSLALPALKRMRHIYVFGRYQLPTQDVHDWTELVWDKGTMGGGDTSSPWGQQHEYIQFGVCVRSPENVTRFGKGHVTARLRKGSVIRVDRVNGAAVNRHPTEKPVRLLRELIESSSHIDDAVLDPFAGVGSTLVAALLESRHAIGIEIDEHYCEIAAKRLEQGLLPLAAIS